MGLLVVGSVALDTVRTPSGYAEEILGGTAVYSGIAASYFTDVSVVAVVGDDFPEQHIIYLQSKGIDTSGLRRQAGRTFRWKGEYSEDLNTARTLDTQLNVFAGFNPRISKEQTRIPYLFLGNIDPDLQRSVLEQMQRPKIVACDTMNYWIDNKRESLQRTLSLVDIVLVNEAEVRHMAEEQNLFVAARRVLSWGPRVIVVKRGEYGAVMVGPKMMFEAPSYPLESVADPTGAGDSFAGGFMGYLAAKDSSDETALRQALVFGSVMGSFNVAEFGPRRLGALTFPEIEGRFREFKRLTEFSDIQCG